MIDDKELSQAIIEQSNIMSKTYSESIKTMAITIKDLERSKSRFSYGVIATILFFLILLVVAPL